jgi:hypothetical protein
MDLLAWLFAGHLAGDYLLQNSWMAMNKNKELLPLLIHSFIYTLAIALFSLMGGGMKIPGLIIIFLSHVVLDQRGFVKWWARKITQSNDVPWLITMLDQSWHIVILAAASLL